MAIGLGFDAVLAGRRTEAAAGVLGDVEEDPIAGRAGAQAVGLAGAEDPGEGLGTDGGPHGDELDFGGMVVQAPDPVLLGLGIKQRWGFCITKLKLKNMWLQLTVKISIICLLILEELRKLKKETTM